MQDHGSWIHGAIGDLLNSTGLKMDALDAVAVTIGPGSYTGLRIGLSVAKGICMALNIPLIAIPTLKMIAATVEDTEATIICPLIDARRMEVFSAVYNKELNLLSAPTALIIDSNSFYQLLENNKVLFIGNGVEKLQKVISHSNAFFSTKKASAIDMMTISLQSFRGKNWADLAYTEPLYVKEFFSGNAV